MTMMANGITTLAKELQNRDRKVVICETFLYLLLISVAIIGNSCVLLAVYRSSRLRTIPNYCIVSLAISDILLPLLCAPNTIAVAIVGYWPFNDNVCQTQGFFVIILACASLLTLTLTAINRFYRMVLTNRYRRIFTKWKTLIMIAFGVGLACLEPLPYLISGRRYVFHPGKLFCFQTAEISLPNFILYFYVGVPTFTLSICYAFVFRQMRIHRRTVQNLRSSSTVVANITHADVKVTKILFITVMGLLACWTPIAVIDFIDTLRGEVSFPRQVYVLYLFLGNSSGAINPFIYGFLNRNFRKEYRKIFSLRKGNSRPQHFQTDLTSFSTRNSRSTKLTANY